MTRYRCYLPLYLAATILQTTPASAQIWDKLSNPRVTVNHQHPPRLGLNIKRVAFGPASGQCSDEILDRMSERLLAGSVEVLDREHLRTLLAEQRLSVSEAVDPQSAVQMGKLLGPSVLIFIRISRCNSELKRTYSDTRTREGVVRTHFATTTVYLRGTLKTVDLTTGKTFVASPIDATMQRQYKSNSGVPEAPPEDEVRDSAIRSAALNASTFLIPWVEQKLVYFYDNKECNLNRAFARLKAGDIQGTVQQSEENVEACKTWPKVKDNDQSHAYYNLGLAYMLVNEHAKALSNLGMAGKIKDSGIIAETLNEVTKSARLAAEFQQVAERTERFEQAQATSKAGDQAAATSVGNGSAKAPAAPIEERLMKLDSLFKKGIITKEEYERKKADLLKEI